MCVHAHMRTLTGCTRVSEKKKKKNSLEVEKWKNSKNVEYEVGPQVPLCYWPSICNCLSSSKFPLILIYVRTKKLQNDIQEMYKVGDRSQTNSYDL